MPLLDEQLGYYRPALMVLFGAVGLLLVIGCLNVASLLLTRALSRDREIAVRIAMGAAPRQLVTQLLAESLVLSVAGAVVGVVAAAVGAAAHPEPHADRHSASRRGQQSTSARSGSGVAVVVVTTMFFGLVPALLLLQAQMTTDLKSGERGSSRGARRIYSVLVAGEVALACALLVSSALLVRTVGRMMDTPTGVDADDVRDDDRAARPGNESSSLGGSVGRDARRHHRSRSASSRASQAVGAPTSCRWRWDGAVRSGIEGEPPPARPEDAPQAQITASARATSRRLGATMAEGRAFAPFDSPESAPVVIVNESFAKRFFTEGRRSDGSSRRSTTGIGPLGLNLIRARPAPPPGSNCRICRRRVTRSSASSKDVRNVPLGQTVEPALYFSTRQFPFREHVHRGAWRPTAVPALAAIRNGLDRAPRRTCRWRRCRRGASDSRKRTAEPRLLMTILVFFGALGGAAGGARRLWSLLVVGGAAHARAGDSADAGRQAGSRRRPRRPAERGARRRRPGRGLVVVRVAESALTRVLYGVSPSDIGSTVAARAVLLAAALIACIPPALRAMRVDPVEGLRAEYAHQRV